MNKEIKNYIGKLPEEQQEKLTEILTWLEKEFPELEGTIKYNQLMYVAHGTFIVGFKPAKAHIGLLCEEVGVEKFLSAASNLGLKNTKGRFILPWKSEVPFELMREIVKFNLADKADLTSFFRK